MDQAVRALFVSEKTFQSESIDIFTTDQTLVKLINFVHGKAETLNIQAQLFGNTLFLVDKDKSMMNMDYSRSLLGAFTTWPRALQNSIYHHRLVQYDFNGLQCLVRFEADGCLSIEDRLMAAALLSDILGSREATDLSSRDLRMKVIKSEQDESSFSQELVSESKPTPPASETWAQKYHWSQLEAVAADAERKKAAMGARNNPSTGPSGKLHPPTSDSARYIRFLAAYPVERFRNITKASQAIAQQYLEMTDHDFEKAVARYFDTQTPGTDLSEGGVALPDAAPSKVDLYAKSKAPLIARLAKAINISSNTAEVYLDQCGNDFQRSVRLHESKMRQLKKNNGKVDSDDEAKMAITFQEREQQRYFKRGRSSAYTNKAGDDELMNVNLADHSLSRKPASYIHHSTLFAFRLVPDAANKEVSPELALRLWSTRIPNIITATHNPNGTVTSICYTDIRPSIDDWEVENQDTLSRTSELLKVIKHTLGKSRGIVQLGMNEDGDMECWEIDTNKEILSAGMKEVWLGLKSLADVSCDEVDDYDFFFNDNHDDNDDDSTDDDDSDVDGDDDFSTDENDQARQASDQPFRLGRTTQDANSLLAGLNPQILQQAQQTIQQQQQQQDYISDESSEWEKEYSEEEC